MDTYTLHQGTAPLFISLPHNGTQVPDDIAARLTPEARRVPDTDWHVAELYDFARALGASIIVPVYSRYVVDLNRPEDDVSLYPGQNTTGLCPIVRFSGDPVYLPGQGPAPDEIAARVDAYWRPYHQALQQELSRIRGIHGRAVLWEGHSIRGSGPLLACVAAGAGSGSRIAVGLQFRDQRPVPGRLHHPALRRSGPPGAGRPA